MSDQNDIRETVKNTYAKVVTAAVKKTGSSCCSGCCGTPADDPITRDLYSSAEAAEVPGDAVLASFGCGNPTALAQLAPGEVVLDLGSGGGIDVLLSAKRVGPTGKAYGLDMTQEMLDLARKNQKEAGATNVEFLQGTIEQIPLPDASVDVVISNCVINLSPDKGQVLREAFRVLRPGGRLAVSDIVLRKELPAVIRRSIEAWAGCIAGALLEYDLQVKLAGAGFVDIEIEPTRVYTKEDATGLVGPNSCCGGGVMDFDPAEIDGTIMSAFVRAKKPVA